MRGVIEAVIRHFQQFTAGGMYLGMFFISVLYLAAEKKEEENRRLFCGYTVLFGFIYGFPVTAYIIMNYCIGELVYWRMFWMLPVWIVTAYVLTQWQWKADKKIWRCLFFAAAAVVLVCGGRAVYTSQNFQKVQNDYKIPDTVIEVCEGIETDAKEMGNTRIKAVVPNELVSYIRQYDAGIAMPYGRNALKGQKMGKRDTYIYESMTSLMYDWKEFAKKLKEEKCNYFVCNMNVENSWEIEAYGFQEIMQTEAYKIYHLE